MGKLKIQFIMLMLFSISMIAQNKTIVPKSGTIVFKCKMTIIDQISFKKSKKDFTKKFYESLKEATVIEKQINGEKIDTTQINNLFKEQEIGTMPFFEQEMFENENGYKFYQIFQDSTTTKYKINNDNIKEDDITINTKTRIFNNGFASGYYNYSDNNIINIKEFKNTTKKINNFKCFKVTYTYSEPDFDEFSSLMSSYINKREMWVTDKIKSDIHPIINDKEILEKYYPLEITEYLDMLKGSIKEYKIEKISLK